MDVNKFLLIINTILVSLSLFPAPLHSAPEAFRVTGLPGFSGTFPSKHYSGHVKLGETSENVKNLFYYFVVSERKPSKDPVVLWLNGGPGCSSFDGFVYEHGPFNFEKAKNESYMPTLHLNPYSWSKVSNIIYLDSPAGVGFSYPSLDTGDFQTANDTRDFLLKWFELYPEFQANPFYLSGESYAGIYIPMLAAALDQARISGAKPHINLKGYLIGNGVCDDEFEGDNALVPFVHGMGLIPEALYKETDKACHGKFQDKNNQKCATLVNSIDRLTQGLNLYDVLEPCYHHPASSSGNTKLPASFRELGKTDKPLPVRSRMFGRAWPYRAPVARGIVPSWSQLTTSLASNGVSPPCIDDTVATKYLNDKAVRDAMHVDPDVGDWNLCTDGFVYNHDVGSMIPYHKNLTNKGYRALIYSGDHDMCVPFTGTEAWTASLGYQIVDQWRPWTSNDQVAGYLQGYAKNLTFLTIKGAGHTVPEYKPRESLDFYKRWLEGHAI